MSRKYGEERGCDRRIDADNEREGEMKWEGEKGTEGKKKRKADSVVVGFN